MVDNILKNEAYLCYKFLIDHTNFEKNHPGCGLTIDRMSKNNMASVASSGFMLSALVIGVERGYDSYETNLVRAINTLANFANNIPEYLGMFAHFVDPTTGKHYKKCEYSTIDTVLFINGMLTVDSYFDDEQIHNYAKKIFERIEWNKFIFDNNGNLQFRMAYNDKEGGDYLGNNQVGWIYQWSMLAEQLSMYILAAGSDDVSEKDAIELFLGFERYNGGYKGTNYIYSPLGSLFVYQYSHAWFDFDKYYDLKGFDWFENSRQACIASKKYCDDLKNEYPTFQYAWGLSACDGPNGYHGYGNPPFGWAKDHKSDYLIKRTDGTIAIYALVSSLPFLPNEVKSTISKLVEKYPEINGQYGFYDSINLSDNLWIGKDYLGIDKGITLLMIDNYYYQTTWNYYMKHNIIKAGIKKLGFIRKG